MTYLFVILLSINYVSAFPSLKTKYSQDSIRFISDDGTIALLQNNSNTLELSRGFKIQNLLIESEPCHFNVSQSYSQKKLLIQCLPHINTLGSLVKDSKIWIMDYKSTQPQLIAKGSNAKLFFEDTWIGFIKKTSNQYIIKNIQSKKEISIDLAPKNHSFSPVNAEMINDDYLLLSDVNEDGFNVLFLIDLNSSKKTVIHKTSLPGKRIEICRQNDYVSFGQFSMTSQYPESAIWFQRTDDSFVASNFSQIYTSNTFDIGKMICSDNKIFFLKDFSEREKSSKSLDLASIEIKSFKLKRETQFNNLTRLTTLDSRVILPLAKDFLVVTGNEDLSQDNLLKKKEE